jgi:hypothetical protein
MEMREVMSAQSEELRALRSTLDRDHHAREEWPDQHFKSERDQHEYDALKDILRGLSKIDPGLTEEELMMARDAIME